MLNYFEWPNINFNEAISKKNTKITVTAAFIEQRAFKKRKTAVIGSKSL